MLTPAQLLGPEGALAKRVAGFTPRPQQQDMAERVAQALAGHGVLVAEAGTGTGKTYAYLVPALQCGGKVIVSTGTKNLQDQLYHRDLPVVREALGVAVSTALLKGRANYLCLYRLDLAVEQGRLSSRAQVGDLQSVRAWARRTRSGDITELDQVAERAAIWPLVTSTADNCLGQECPRFSECYVVKARRLAQEADVVVVNHHLLFADMALKDEGFGELLPAADAFILDEAHQLPEIASQFFGVTLTARQLLDLVRDVVTEHAREAGDMAALPEAAGRLEKAARDTRLAFGAATRRGSWGEVAHNAAVRSGLHEIEQALTALEQILGEAAARGKGLESCWRRGQLLRERLALFCGDAPADYVKWFETFAQSFALYLTPLDIGGPFRALVERYQASWIFTSATLAVGDSFEHFCRMLALEGATARWDSPFDYARNALLYIPEQLPLPAAPHYTEAVVDAAVAVLEASGGRAFLLFTSHRALSEAVRLLKDRIGYPLLVQGTAPRSELLNRFRSLGNAVLLGTGSFWEGVDVRGPALSCVIIDKLPFASPGDPVLQARLELLRRRGVDPFLEFQLPEAVIALKQGAGRLIRDEQDRGVLVVCDPRIMSKAYGRRFLSSLPPMGRTRDIEGVRDFFSAASTANTSAQRSVPA